MMNLHLSIDNYSWERRGGKFHVFNQSTINIMSNKSFNKLNLFAPNFVRTKKNTSVILNK